MSLTKIITQSIEEKGPLTFHDFMELALYYPELGYYSGNLEKLGPRGDYYTSPVLSELYGQMIARQLEEMWCALGKGSFTLVEYGAGTGVLCNDVLNYLQAHSDLYTYIDYCIIERSTYMRAREKELICHPGKVRWLDSIGQLGSFKGCVFSNEVLDNFSVHQVVRKDELMEACLDNRDGIVETAIPASPHLKEYFLQDNIQLPNGYRTEVNLQVKEWIADIAGTLEQGFVMTIDYGYPSWEYYHPRRSEGTLVCYRQHKVSFNPYEHVGEQDITAHVNFSALNKWGMQAGFTYGGFTNQCNFLRSLGMVGHIRTLEQKKKTKCLTEEDLRQVVTLLHGMGNKFKVLMQHKNCALPRLSGMMCSDPL